MRQSRFVTPVSFPPPLVYPLLAYSTLAFRFQAIAIGGGKSQGNRLSGLGLATRRVVCVDS
jgi:hypothetical protein